MTLFRPLAVLLLLAAAACASTRTEPAASSWYVMRHLQKAEGQDPPLSAVGAGNAERLASWFGKDRPAAIYASTTRRARETAAPLAARLGLSVKEYDPRDTPGLVARAKAESGTVLIVGHSNTVPDIVAALGGKRPEPIAHDQFGDVWTISGSRQTVTRTRIGG